MRSFSWEGIWMPKVPPGEVILRAAIVYLFLLLIFRLIPRKELGRYTVSDILLLLLLTTAVRRTIVLDDDSITTAFIGLATLLTLNYGLNRLSQLGRMWSNLIQGRRILLIRDGKILKDGMRYAKFSTEELRSRLREAGTDDFNRVQFAYLERDGQVSFVLFEENEMNEIEEEKEEEREKEEKKKKEED